MWGDQKADIIAANYSKKTNSESKKEWVVLGFFMGLEVMNHLESIALEGLLGRLKVFGKSQQIAPTSWATKF